MIKFKLNLIGNISDNEILEFQNFIKAENIEGVQNIEIVQKDAKEGEMSIGEVIASISILLTALSSPLTELVKCIQTYITTFKTDIEIETESGKKIRISAKEKPEELIKLMQKTLKEDFDKEKDQVNEDSELNK